MAVHVAPPPAGFESGLTEITRLEETVDNTGIALSVLHLEPGEKIQETTAVETAWLLMQGRVRFEVGVGGVELARGSLFDELPSSVHVAAGTPVTIASQDKTELTIYRTHNVQRFEPVVYLPGDVRNEPRGKGQVGDACWRYVRTIFDATNAAPEANLVLGEVITLPGRWSSYPPHHHPQPEIYHYRFDKPQGYGHAELGERILKVRHGDTVKIFDGNDHAQAAAPGYAMYYSWVIRHLPGQKYNVPEFTKEHTWLTEEGASFWRPLGEPDVQ